MNKPLVEIKSLYSVLKSESKTSYVMNDGNLTFNKGARIGIIGESGSGKTELLKTITGTQSMIPGIVQGSVTFYVDKNKTHSVYLKDLNNYIINPEHEKIKRNLIGFIPQDPKSYLNPYWTIKEIFKESFQIKNRDMDFNQFLNHYLNYVDMDYNIYQNKTPDQLSGGEAQRVMVALVLSKEPQLIIADESSTGLDVTRQRTIIQTFKKIHTNNPDITTVFISHDLGFLSHVVDEYFVLYGGFICEHITDKKQFLNLKKLHPYTQDLISSLVYDSNDNKISHDSITGKLLDEPLFGCPYYNSKCTKKNCSNKNHFHNEIPPMHDIDGNTKKIDITKYWKRSR